MFTWELVPIIPAKYRAGFVDLLFYYLYYFVISFL